jgi:DNA-binding NarL/FixJ family response regulator
LRKATGVTNRQAIILVAGEDPNALARNVQKLRAGLGAVWIVEAGTMWEAARQCERLPQVDFIVIDNELVESVGTRFLSGLGALQPGARLMVIGPPRSRSAAIKMLEAGAAAYLPSDLTPSAVAKAFDLVMSGAIFAPIPPATRVPQAVGATPQAVVVPFPRRSADASRLSASQRDILALLARGRSNAEIGFLLGLSETAVAAQVTALMRRIGASEPAALRPRLAELERGPSHSGPDAPVA